LKTIEPILMPISTRSQRGRGMKRPTLGARKSKIKVTWGRRWIWRRHHFRPLGSSTSSFF